MKILCHGSQNFSSEESRWGWLTKWQMGRPSSKRVVQALSPLDAGGVITGGSDILYNRSEHPASDFDFNIVFYTAFRLSDFVWNHVDPTFLRSSSWGHLPRVPFGCRLPRVRSHRYPRWSTGNYLICPQPHCGSPTGTEQGPSWFTPGACSQMCYLATTQWLGFRNIRPSPASASFFKGWGVNGVVGRMVDRCFVMV